MKEDFKELFRRFSFLRPQDLITLFKICSFKTIKKGELLVKEGELCKYTFLIRKGIVRTYILTKDGSERTIRLAKEKDFTSPYQCFLKGLPSSEYLEALEDCKVVAIDTNRLNEIAKTNIRILQLAHEGVKEAFIEAIMRVEFFTTLTPEQRYNNLFESSPELLQRVPQKYLASYLGVTTVSLSRIRNR